MVGKAIMGYMLYINGISVYDITRYAENDSRAASAAIPPGR